MDAIDAIMTRRSIRKYTGKKITDDQLKVMLEAAMAAPSAMNAQPWRFVVIREKGTLEGIMKFHPYSSMLKEADMSIAVCAELSSEKAKGFWVQDCSAATQNILLAAHALGLGAVWLGVYPREDLVEGVKNILKLPEGIIPLCLISLGHPAESKGRSGRYDEKKIMSEKWHR